MTATQPVPPSQQLAAINRLVLKAFRCKTRQELTFVILNDTFYSLPYERAFLWDWRYHEPKLLGVSGQISFEMEADLIEERQYLVTHLKDPQTEQHLHADSFSNSEEQWQQLQNRLKMEVLWLPIKNEEGLILGLWLERWQAPAEQAFSQENVDLVRAGLLPGYATAWAKMAPLVSPHLFSRLWARWPLVLLTLFALLLIIRVPLRVVAPFEVVPKDPYYITAPLDGIVDEIVVQPGEIVTKGAPLVEYDKRVPMHELKVAQKEVAQAQSELDRAMTLGLKERSSLVETTTLQLKLEKAKVQLVLAEQQSHKLTLKAPIPGVVILDNADEWRGKPVKVGERILVISDPSQTELRIWIPENDNIPFDLDEPISVFFNISPAQTYYATIRYIANESRLSDRQIPGFEAEAEWVETPPIAKLGLKGTAIIYGERVSLGYLLIRKPWAYVRQLLGI